MKLLHFSDKTCSLKWNDIPGKKRTPFIQRENTFVYPIVSLFPPLSPDTFPILHDGAYRPGNDRSHPLYAIIASQRFMPDQIEHAQFVRQRPCFRFINPHQRSMKHELLVHGKVQCHIQRLDKSIGNQDNRWNLSATHRSRYDWFPIRVHRQPQCSERTNSARHKRIRKLSAGFTSSIVIVVSVSEFLPRLPIKKHPSL